MLRVLFPVSLTIFGLVWHPVSYASITKLIPSQDLQGENGLGVIQLPLGHTVNLSYINSGELVRQVRIDDRGKVVVSFDSPLCPYAQTGSGGSDGCRAGASVIYLRQLKNQIDFDPNAVAGYRADEGNRATMLTVITTRPDGSQRKIYSFELQLTNGSRAPRTIEITGGNSRRPALTSVGTTAISRGAPPPSISPATKVAQIRTGLAKAYAQNLVALDSPVRSAMAEFIRLIDQGQTFDNAQAQSEIPTEFLDWLQTLATQ
jgi:hypothetical protein